MLTTHKYSVNKKLIRYSVVTGALFCAASGATGALFLFSASVFTSCLVFAAAVLALPAAVALVPPFFAVAGLAAAESALGLAADFPFTAAGFTAAGLGAAFGSSFFAGDTEAAFAAGSACFGVAG